jgi:hypothetical protein
MTRWSFRTSSQTASPARAANATSPGEPSDTREQSQQAQEGHADVGQVSIHRPTPKTAPSHAQIAKPASIKIATTAGERVTVGVCPRGEIAERG